MKLKQKIGDENLEDSEIIQENENTDSFENTIIEQPIIDTTNYIDNYIISNTVVSNSNENKRWWKH